MAMYKIDTVRAANAVTQLSGLGQNLDSLKNQVRTARTSMTLQTNAAARLKGSIQLIESDILDIAANMSTLSEALDTIINFYTSTENKILSNAGYASDEMTGEASDSTGGNLIQQFLGKIRQWLIDLGFIPDKDTTEITKAQEKAHDKYMRGQINQILKRDRFSESTWKKASVEERKAILNEYLQEVAAVLGLSIGKINFTYKKGRTENGVIYYNMGSYSDTLNRVSINQWVLENPSIDSYELMSTIVHEMRHAYQHAACENPENFNVSRETIEQWQESFDHYRSTSEYARDYGMTQSEAYRAYRNQAVERDARSFAGQS